ncbi:hypothetical protein CSQ96_09955 [Janthinobacterium sp. BJB412]|nr:hypothetical protein CSQ96_09955 [Janthinobacterium sp. BJB412]
MEPRLYRLTVVVAVLGFLFFASLAGMTAKDYFHYTSSGEEYHQRARLNELERRAAANPDPSTLVPFTGELDPPGFNWSKQESDAKWKASYAQGQMIQFLMAAAYIPAIIFGFFYTVRWIMTGKLRPWIPK